MAARKAEKASGPIRVMRIIARLNIGGPARHVALLSAGMNDAQYQTMLVTGSLGEGEGDMSYLAREAGVEPVVIPTLQREISPLEDFKALLALVRLMRDYKPHVVHTHTAKAGLLGRFAAFLCGVPVIVHTFHGHVFSGYFGWAKTQLFLWLERITGRMSDAVLTISERLRDDLLSYHIAPPSRMVIVPLGLELSPLAHLEGSRGRLRQELGCSTEEKLVGIIGRLVPIKRHELFFAAARRIADVDPSVRFLVIGDGERCAELEALAKEMGLEQAVIFTGWRTDLEVIYADLDAVVISSANEGTPVSIIEAMAAGVPVVSTSVGGVPDLLQNGRLGALVPPGDASALAQAIQSVLSGPNPHTGEAQQWVMAQYAVSRLVSDIRALYARLLAEKGFEF